MAKGRNYIDDEDEDDGGEPMSLLIPINLGSIPYKPNLRPHLPPPETSSPQWQSITPTLEKVGDIYLSWCLECGNDFEIKDNGRPRKFCSDKCKVSYHRAKKKRAEEMALIQKQNGEIVEAVEDFEKMGFSPGELTVLKVITKEHGSTAAADAAILAMMVSKRVQE